MTRTSETTVFAVDGHVHVHGELPDLEVIGRRMSQLAPGAIPVLMLAENEGEDGFLRLKHAFEKHAGKARSDEATAGVLIVPGWQVVSAEGLELLVQGVEQFDTFGAPAECVIEAALSLRASVTLPWGFGKWIGRRRRLVRTLLDIYGNRLLVGDISGRPPGWTEPLFAGRAVLRGADNLPLAGTAQAIGRYGSLIECADNGPASEASLMERLRRPEGSFDSFGSRHGLARAVMDQLRIRARSSAA